MTKSATAVRGESDLEFASAGSEEDLLQRATVLIPALRARRDETEERRSLTLETRRDLMESGVHRIFQPRRFGGGRGFAARGRRHSDRDGARLRIHSLGAGAEYDAQLDGRAVAGRSPGSGLAAEPRCSAERHF